MLEHWLRSGSTAREMLLKLYRQEAHRHGTYLDHHNASIHLNARAGPLAQMKPLMHKCTSLFSPFIFIMYIIHPGERVDIPTVGVPLIPIVQALRMRHLYAVTQI